MPGDRLPVIASVAAALVLVLSVGALTARYGWFPGAQITWAAGKVERVYGILTKRPSKISIPGEGPATISHEPDRMAEGLTFVVVLAEDLIHRAQVIRADGTVVHEWPVDWFKIWQEDDFLPETRRPRRQPGASIHGSHVLADGSLVFNFEYLSTIKLDACGQTVWKLGNLGHHSVDVLADGTVWAGAQIFHPRGSDTGHQNHFSPLQEDTAQMISPDGEILKTISTLDIFWENDLLGFLFATSQLSRQVKSVDDPMHLNDVEIFPEHLEEGVFSHGDIMLSIRNINSVVVIDPDTLRIKHMATGMFLRQHDPDFTSGNTYTLFDNRNLGPKPGKFELRSRILEITAHPAGGVEQVREVFRGQTSPSFYSRTKGRHQILPNGNALIVVSDEGRVLELAPDGALVWEYRNAIGGGYRGLVTEAQRLPAEMDIAFFKTLRQECERAE